MLMSSKLVSRVVSCAFTTYSTVSKQRGKRPYYYKEENVDRVGVNLCKKAVEDA